MSFKTSFSFVAVLALLAVAQVRAASQPVVTHVAEEKKTTVTIRFTQVVRILLPVPAAAAPGFEWQIISNDSRILRLTSSPKPAGPGEKAPEAEKAAPAPATNLWATSFLALRPGRSVVRLVYVRASGSGEETPIDNREVVVTVN